MYCYYTLRSHLSFIILNIVQTTCYINIRVNKCGHSYDSKSLTVLDTEFQLFAHYFHIGVLGEVQHGGAGVCDGVARLVGVPLDLELLETERGHSGRGEHELQEVLLLLLREALQDLPEHADGRVRGRVRVRVLGHLLQLVEVYLLLATQEETQLRRIQEPQLEIWDHQLKTLPYLVYHQLAAATNVRRLLVLALRVHKLHRSSLEHGVPT